MPNLNELLKEIEERAEKATPGPWYEKRYGCNFNNDGHLSVGNEKHGDALFGGNYFANLDFVAHSRTDIPRLLAALRKAIEQRDFYCRDARDAFDCKLATKTDDAELTRILTGSASIGSGE